MSPQWSRPTNKVAMEALTVPVERKTAGQKWTHDQRVNEAAMKAEKESILEKTRKQFRYSPEGRFETQKEKETRMRRIRLAQMQAFEEECNLQFLELTKERVSKEVGKTRERISHRSLGTLPKSPVMDAKWCKFHKEWGLHTEGRNLQCESELVELQPGKIQEGIFLYAMMTPDDHVDDW